MLTYYCLPVIDIREKKYWSVVMVGVIHLVRQRNFCTYSLMEAESGTILHLETVDKREVNYKSPVMECEDLKRCLNHISTNTACTIKELTTDASSSIIS